MVMFKARRIRTHGKGRRRRQHSHRPRNSFKARPKKQPEAIVSDMSKLDTSKNDLFYTDSTATSPYAWSDVYPSVKINSNDMTRGMLSLKQCCARKVANEVDQLEASNLDQVPDNLCLLIWKRILELHNDSFHLYTMFANRLNRNRVDGFMPHDYYSRDSNCDLQRIRREVINTIRPINATCYRVEVLLSNISLTSLIKRINECKFHKYVLLNLSQMNPNHFSYDDYFMMFNIPNLIGLDLSNNTVIDDNFIFNLCRSIKSSKLSHLKAVLLNNCPKVTTASLKSLLGLVDDKEVSVSLRFIESDINVLKEKTYWRCIPTMSQLSNLPLSMKTFYNHSSKQVLRNGGESSVRTHSRFEKFGYSNKTTVIDIFIGKGSFRPGNHVANCESITLAWKNIQRQVSNPSRYLYIKDTNLQETNLQETNLKVTSLKEESTTGQIQPDNKENIAHPVQSKRKPVKRLIKPNVKSFFAL